MNSIIPRVSHRPLCCVFIEVKFEKLKTLEILIFQKSLVKVEGENQHAVITSANTFNSIKISTLCGKSQGLMFYLSNAP